MTTIKFLETKKSQTNCWALHEHFGDILSTLEKEILIRARIFLRTRPSNWSFNVQGHRIAERGFEKVENDRVIFDVFQRKR